jgi:hypothetical protein
MDAPRLVSAGPQLSVVDMRVALAFWRGKLGCSVTFRPR